jgi:hypothetical protein
MGGRDGIRMIAGTLFGVGHTQYSLVVRPELAFFGVVACFALRAHGITVAGEDGKAVSVVVFLLGVFVGECVESLAGEEGVEDAEEALAVVFVKF